jgi:hypothetical protein
MDRGGYGPSDAPLDDNHIVAAGATKEFHDACVPEGFDLGVIA